jgi:hypothetical protein
MIFDRRASLTAWKKRAFAPLSESLRPRRRDGQPVRSWTVPDLPHQQQKVDACPLLEGLWRDNLDERRATQDENVAARVMMPMFDVD